MRVNGTTPLSVAAIVPVFNRATVVVEALASIARQSRPPCRLVIVDDGSTDGTADRVQFWLDCAPRSYEATLVRQPNRGAAAARNHGARLAVGCELLAFLDSDDLWPIDYLQRMTATLAGAPDAVAASCDRLDVDSKTGHKRCRNLANLCGASAQTILMGGAPGVPNTVVRAAAFDHVGGFAALPCYEDYHLMLRLSLLGSWQHTPGAPVLVRRNLGHQRQNIEPPLSKKYQDRSLIAAQAIDRFVYEEGGAHNIPEAMWRKRLAELWCRAGADLYRLGRSKEARDCFQRALRLRPFYLRALWHSMYLKIAALQTGLMPINAWSRVHASHSREEQQTLNPTG